MTRFIVSRLIQFPLILAVIYLITFLMAWVVPGDPFLRNDKNLSPEALLARRREFHAESWQSFLGYYSMHVVRGDFGRSMEYEEWSVNDILKSALPVSITLGLFALVVALAGGVGLGTVAAVRRDGVLDWLSLSVALIGISFPSFVAAAVLFIAFVAKLHWFPVGEWGHLRNLILPGIALALLPMAYIARLTRGVSMLDTLGNDYVRTARAKGLARGVVIWKHALRNALLPVLSYLGPAAAYSLTGSFVVEKVFYVPGLGQHFVNSIMNRDRTLILGTVIVYSFFLLLFNLLVDIGYAFVDPRIDVTASRTGAA